MLVRYPCECKDSEKESIHYHCACNVVGKMNFRYPCDNKDVKNTIFHTLCVLKDDEKGDFYGL